MSIGKDKIPEWAQLAIEDEIEDINSALICINAAIGQIEEAIAGMYVGDVDGIRVYSPSESGMKELMSTSEVINQLALSMLGYACGVKTVMERIDEDD